MAIGLAVALALSPVLGSPARAADPPRTIVVRGAGYGHGVGMGQWGAYRRARNGAHWRRMVKQYYRGARIAVRPRHERIRVLIDAGRRVTVRGRPNLRVWNRRGHLARARTARVARTEHGKRVQVRSRGQWRTVATRGGPTMINTYRPLWVYDDGVWRGYRGRVRVVRSHGSLAVINSVAMQTYLRGVVPREMPASWPTHALRAQAVAARSYATRVRQVSRARGAPYDICASTACQLYQGYGTRSRWRARTDRVGHPRANAAVRATNRRVLVARGRTVLAMYSSSTGGHSASGRQPGLRAVRDRADRKTPYHRWRVRIAAASIRWRWPGIGRLQRIAVVSRDGHGPWGGRAERIRLVGARRTRTVDASTFRAEFGLRSDLFRLRPSRARYRFRFDMGYGTSHPAVSALQHRLLREGFYPRDAPRTSYFGTITRASVRRYQRAHGISSTGYLGPITRRHLNRRA